MAPVFVRARIDEKLKNKDSKVLAEFGLTLTDIVCITPASVAKHPAVPTALKVPNAETHAAVRELRALMKTYNARFS